MLAALIGMLADLVLRLLDARDRLRERKSRVEVAVKPEWTNDPDPMR